MFYPSDSFPPIEGEFLQKCWAHLMREKILWQEFAGGKYRRSEASGLVLEVVGLHSFGFLSLAPGVVCEIPGESPTYVRGIVPLKLYPDICVSLGEERRSCEGVNFLENFATYQWNSQHQEPAFFLELFLDKARYPNLFGDPQLREFLIRNERMKDGMRPFVLESREGSLLERLKKVVSNVLKVSEERLTLETNYYKDLDADSLDLVNLFYFLQEEFELDVSPLEQDIPQEEWQLLQTLGGTLNYLAEHSKLHAGES